MIELETFREASCGGGHEGGHRGLLSYDVGFVEIKSRIDPIRFQRPHAMTITTTNDDDDDDSDDDDDNRQRRRQR